ncbi:hypothetical protein [Desulfobacula toluolica]|uniref:Uncharacterized protein n=1 Tax=Desulfobacula toluolica (strain DSM 7467 / Tol2) TaxID=651182 RepID=K0N9W5_DESTT|nr:hypothetical protein [Desulfobacula toluolica]CCK80794.1 uncharacterized protein TOL2_C26350 [Desulfobacula toluolica Tol2]
MEKLSYMTKIFITYDKNYQLFFDPLELTAKILWHASCCAVFESTVNSAPFGLVLELTVNYGTQRRER